MYLFSTYLVCELNFDFFKECKYVVWRKMREFARRMKNMKLWKVLNIWDESRNKSFKSCFVSWSFSWVKDGKENFSKVEKDWVLTLRCIWNEIVLLLITMKEGSKYFQFVTLTYITNNNNITICNLFPALWAHEPLYV